LKFFSRTKIAKIQEKYGNWKKLRLHLAYLKAYNKEFFISEMKKQQKIDVHMSKNKNCIYNL